MKIKNRTMYEDINGKKHPQFVVRSLGPRQGFGVIDVLTNALASAPQPTRVCAWEELRLLEACFVEEEMAEKASA